MTATPPPAPDTRPRASLELTAADLARLHAGDVVVGYTVTDMGGSRERFTVALAQPAPTPSGDAREGDKARALREWHADNPGARDDHMFAFLDGLDRGRAEYAAALLEAREKIEGQWLQMQDDRDRFEAAEAEAARLQRDCEALTAERDEAADERDAVGAALQEAREQEKRDVRLMREYAARAEAAEARLREVEGERDRLRAHNVALGRELDLAVWRTGQALEYPMQQEVRDFLTGVYDDINDDDDGTDSAASRPVPAARVEITDTYGMRETFTDGSRPATPSTDEEGRA